MRALATSFRVPAALLLLLWAAPAMAAEPCGPQDMERFTAAGMVADADLRAEAEAALSACAGFALDQFRNTGEIEERVLAQVAALAGRASYASYAADEVPKGSPAVVALLSSAFRQLYPHLRALPEEENAAAMRTIVYHLIDQAAPRSTGSVPTAGPQAPAGSATGATP